MDHSRGVYAIFQKIHLWASLLRDLAFDEHLLNFQQDRAASHCVRTIRKTLGLFISIPDRGLVRDDLLNAT